MGVLLVDSATETGPPHHVEEDVEVTLQRLVAALGLPSQITDKAAILYFKIKSRHPRWVRGNEKALQIACLYAACRLSNNPIPVSKLASVTGSRTKLIEILYRRVIKKLSLETPAPGPEKYVASIAHSLQLPQTCQNEALRIIDQAKENGLASGRSPVSVAAAAICAACHINDIKKSQREIAEAAQISELTLRNRYHELSRSLSTRYPALRPRLPSQQSTTRRESNLTPIARFLLKSSKAQYVTLSECVSWGISEEHWEPAIKLLRDLGLRKTESFLGETLIYDPALPQDEIAKAKQKIERETQP